MSKQSILIVEDSMDQMKRYLDLAKSCDFEARGVSSLNDAKEILSSKRVDILLTDIHLQSGPQTTFEGLSLLTFVKQEHPDILALAMSTDPDVATYEKSLARGASHYIKKPILNRDELLIAIHVAKSKRNLQSASKKLYSDRFVPPELQSKCRDGVVLPDRIRDLAFRIAKHGKTPSILMGETGSGKEEVARLIHCKRCEIEGAIPFVAVNCATLNGDIGTSLLFGHRKGAFTGADQTTNGYIGEANGGILFLDEVHTLSIECQQRLLRVLSGGTYERVGESKPMRSEFQLLSASSTDLGEAVESGKLVEDLFMRLSGTNITIPPLRDRRDEIPILVALYFAKERLDVPSEEIVRIAEKCKSYTWRGNIRQLFSSLQTLVVMAGGDLKEIRAENLAESGELFKTQDKKLKALFSKLTGININSFEKVADALTTDQTLESALENYEELILRCALNRHKKLVDVADALSISRSWLDVRKKKYNIQ